MVDFAQYNELNRTPGVFAEFDASQATSVLISQARAVIVAQRTSAGTAAAGSFNRIFSVDQAKELAGVGSQAADMVDIFNANNANIQLDLVLLDDSGTAAKKTITVTGPATDSGTLNIYIGGRRIIVPVSVGDTADEIATAIDAEINLQTDLIMSSTVVTNVVTLTARNAGEWTQVIPIQVNPRTRARGGTEQNPAGTSFAIANTVTGSGNPSVSVAIAALPDKVINFFAMPYTDAANLTLWETEIERRNDANVQKEGFGFGAKFGTVGSLVTFGNTQNARFHTIIDAGVGTFNVEHHYTAAYAGRASRISSNDPAVPWQFEQLVGIIPDFAEDQRDIDDENDLLFNGVAASRVSECGSKLFILREITNFQLNTLGQPDVSFLDSQTPLTIQFIRQSLIAHLSSKFGKGFKLADDGAQLSKDSTAKVVTPSIVRAEVILWADLLIQDAIIENIDQFIADLVVVRSTSDVNRVDIFLPPDLVNQMRIFAAVIAFRL